jgi:uroporphyrinogen decarboxylase
MISKERVHTALAHEEPDRVPMDVWLTPEVEKRLMREAGLDDAGEMRVRMGHDCLTGYVGLVASFYLSEEPTYVCPWGITWARFPYSGGQGSYTEMVGHPLAGDDALLDSYKAPDPHEPRQYDAIASLVKRYGSTHAIVGGVNGSVFEGPWYLRGMDRFLQDMLINKDYANRLMDIVMGFHLEAGLHLIGMGCDIIMAGDDVGTQDRMLISPELWREFVKPRYGALFGEYRKANPGIKIAAHICGFIEPIIDDLVEVGLDILNPVQPLSMDPAGLKKRYGADLSFWGAVDDQKVLPFGSPRDVEEEVRLRLRQLAPGGGYILCPSHNIQPTTPPGNLRAFYRAARAFGTYPLSV